MLFRNSTTKEPYTDAEIEAGLREESILHFKDYTPPKEKKLKDLIQDFLKLSVSHPTFDNKDYAMCTPGRSRSFCDLYCFIIGIRPKIKVRRLRRELHKLMMDRIIFISFCGGISRGTLHLKGYEVGEFTLAQLMNTTRYTNEFGRSLGEFYELKK